MTVAKAAPRMPQSNQHINSMSSTTLTKTVKMVAYIAFSGLLAARSTEFIPKYMCVTTLPRRIISI